MSIAICQNCENSVFIIGFGICSNAKWKNYLNHETFHDLTVHKCNYNFNFRDAWSQIFCLEKTGKLGCFEGVLNCKNSQKRATSEQKNENIFIEEEQTIRGLANGAFEDFSYNDCQRGNRISKRHAIMKRSLSTEQAEDLIRVFGKRSDLMD